MTDELDAMRQRSEETEQALHRAESELATRRAETDQWKARAKALQDTLDGVKRNLAETATEAAHWADRCEELEMRLARAGFEQQSAQAALKQEIEDLQARLSIQESRAGDHRRNLERRVERLNSEAAARVAASQRDGEAALRGKQAEIEALRGEVARMEVERDNALAGRDKVLDSTSWRLTAPLRKLVSLLRR